MPDIKISELPVASIVNDADIVVLNQGGDTKTAAKSLIVAGLATTDQISGFTNSAQVEALASAQIAAITPASIGALSTDAASGFATTSQISGFATTDQLSGFATTTDIQGIAFTSQLSGFATTDQISGFTNSAQVKALASAQIAAITPASIGAFATSDVIAISNGGTGATNAVSALANLGGITSAQVPALNSTQLAAYVLKAGSTMDGRLIMAATTDQAKANIGGFLTGAPAPASVIPGDVWVSNQSKLSFSPSTGVSVNVAGLSQTNTFNQTQTIEVGGAVTSLAVSNNGTGRAATFAANSTAPTVAITQSGTGAALSVDSKGILFYDGSLQSTATGHYQARLASTVNQSGTSNTGVTPNTFTYETFGVPQCDGRNIILNDLLVFTAQADQKQNGPWIVTTMNTGSAGAILTRPTWFTGSSVKQGITLNIGDGLTRSGQILSVTKATNGLIAVGGDNLTIIVVNYNQNTVQQSQITGFATTTQLGGYATTSQISGIAYTSQLSGFATTSQLSGYATTTQIDALQPALTSAAPLALSQGGTGATTAVAALSNLGALSATAAAGGDLSGNYPNPTVAKIQGQAVSATAPTSGQVLTWNGSAWVATAPAAGGSGGGGVLFYFNNTTAGGTIPAGAKELGRIAEISQSTITSGTLPTGTWTQIAGFVSDNDPLDPNLEFLPAGIFDFNLWCTGTANINAPTLLRAVVYRWTGSTSIQVGNPSGSAVVANGPTSTQTSISMVIPQTDIDPTDRLYIVLEAQASGSGHTVSIDLGNNTPSHVHTTIPSVGGTGVVKVINGVPQNPASLITDSDVSTAAPLALNKIQMSQVSVSAGAGLTGGGDLSTSRTLALATTGIAAITAGSSSVVPVITTNIYGQITALTTEAISAGTSGTVTAITAGTGLTGGTITTDGIIALETAGPGVLTNVGSSAAVPVISVDAYGRISALETASLAGLGTVTSIAMTSQVSGLSFSPTSAITDNGTFNLTGTLDISNGGTGATDAPSALSNLGGITSASLSGFATTDQLSAYQPALTTAAPLGIALGGTGATTAAAALSALGGVASSALSGYATTEQLSGYATTTQVAGLQPALTTAAPAAIAQGGTGATTAVAALNNLGGITSAALSGYASTSQLAGLQTALTSAAPLAISQGGTGAITAADARSTVGGNQLITVRSIASLALASAGTITNAVFTANSAVVTFTSTTATLVPGQSLSAGVTTGVIRTVDSPTQITMSVVAGATTTVNPTVFNSTRTTLVTSNTTTIDGKTLALNDVVLLNQTATPQSGPWIVTGGVGTAVSLTRPSWFTGNLLAPVNMLVTAGSFFLGHSLSVCLNTGTPTTEIGIEGLALSLISSRGNSNAILGSNTYTARQVFAASSATGVAPFAFQAGALNTTSVAHQVEWDGAQMYVSNTAAERMAIATSKAQINAQTGTTYTIALADAGYLITANNAGAIAVSIPTDATINFPIGTQLLVMQLGAGQVTVSAVTPGTTTIISRSGTKTAGQYALISLIKVAANQWVVGGDATT